MSGSGRQSTQPALSRPELFLVGDTAAPRFGQARRWPNDETPSAVQALPLTPSAPKAEPRSCRRRTHPPFQPAADKALVFTVDCVSAPRPSSRLSTLIVSNNPGISLLHRNSSPSRSLVLYVTQRSGRRVRISGIFITKRGPFHPPTRPTWGCAREPDPIGLLRKRRSQNSEASLTAIRACPDFTSRPSCLC